MSAFNTQSGLGTGPHLESLFRPLFFSTRAFLKASLPVTLFRNLKASGMLPPQSTTMTKPEINPWLIAVAVMLATFMEVLDTSIAAVALPYIAGSLSATNDEATWVLTSYLVANAIVLPASSWFSLRFGR